MANERIASMLIILSSEEVRLVAAVAPDVTNFNRVWGGLTLIVWTRPSWTGSRPG